MPTFMLTCPLKYSHTRLHHNQSSVGIARHAAQGAAALRLGAQRTWCGAACAAARWLACSCLRCLLNTCRLAAHTNVLSRLPAGILC